MTSNQSFCSQKSSFSCEIPELLKIPDMSKTSLTWQEKEQETSVRDPNRQVTQSVPKMGKWTDTNYKSNPALVCPIALLSSKLVGQSIFALESGNQNILDECTPKTGKQTNPNFESNQALVVSNHPVKF